MSAREPYAYVTASGFARVVRQELDEMEKLYPPREDHNLAQWVAELCNHMGMTEEVRRALKEYI